VTIRAERHVNLDDQLADAEIAACRAERQRKNGNGNQSPERALCDCPESLVNGLRVAAPGVADCLYCCERSKLVEAAAPVATARVGDPVKERSRIWTHCFAQVMEEFARPLLRSNNGAGEHRAA
jgi:hypothetical protein